jgi:hypothetical protein
VRIALATVSVCVLGLVTGAGSATSGAHSGERSLLDVGDSLSVGTDAYLRERLPGYRIEERNEVGLHSWEVAGIVRARRSLPAVLVVSAGTNDDPRAVEGFSRSVASVLAVAGARRCVVWPTIARPDQFGTSYVALNRVLTRVATDDGNLVLVDWAAMTRRHPRWLRADGVHATAAGYRARAHAIAASVRARCE